MDEISVEDGVAMQDLRLLYGFVAVDEKDGARLGSR